MGIPDLFKTVASYLDFVPNFLLFQGLDTYVLQSSTSYVLVSYYVCGFALARFFEASDPLRKLVSHTQIPAEREEAEGLPDYPRRGKGNVQIVEPEPIFSPLIRSIWGNLGFHLFLVLSFSILGVKPAGIANTVNSILAFNAVYLPVAAFIEPFRAAGKIFSIHPHPTRAESLGGLLLLGLPMLLGLLSEIYRFWSMAKLHGIEPFRFLVPAGVYWGLALSTWIGYGVVSAIVRARRRRRTFENW